MISWIDVFAVIFLAFFIFNGAQRGVLRSLFDLFAVLLALFASAQLYTLLTTTIMPFLRTQQNVGYVITFAVLWISLYLALDLLGAAIQKFVKVTFIGMVESLGGAFLGLIKGILIIGIFIQLANIFPLPYDAYVGVKNSWAAKLTIPTLRQTYSTTFGMFPRIDFFLKERVIPAMPKEVKEKVKD